MTLTTSVSVTQATSLIQSLTSVTDATILARHVQATELPSVLLAEQEQYSQEEGAPAPQATTT